MSPSFIPPLIYSTEVKSERVQDGAGVGSSQTFIGVIKPKFYLIALVPFVGPLSSSQGLFKDPGELRGHARWFSRGVGCVREGWGAALVVGGRGAEGGEGRVRKSSR